MTPEQIAQRIADRAVRRETVLDRIIRETDEAEIRREQSAETLLARCIAHHHHRHPKGRW